MSELRALSTFLTGLTYDDVPQPVLQATLMCVLDTVGAAVGAAEQQQIRQVTAKLLGSSGAGEISLWGQQAHAPLSTAVFLNAMKGHTLELDDVHTSSKTHIGTVVIPAAWGLAEYLGKSGREFLLAVLCGYEAMSRIGMAFGVSSHRNRGWHVTSTAGTFGAAAACGKLLGLDTDQMTFALGMAGTQSFGTWAFLANSASSKVLHPARAASTGLESALLAGAGMTGPEFILTAQDGGLLCAMSDEADPALVCKDLGSQWQVLLMDNKPYPSCRSTHCAIDAALELRAGGLDLEQIDKIEVSTYLVGNKQCGLTEGSRNPHTAVQAKFSTPYTVARALLSGNVVLDDFLSERIEEPAVRALLEKVEVITDEAFTARYPAHWGCRLTLLLKDGSRLVKEVPDASGSVKNPLSPQQAKAKASALIQSVCPSNSQAMVDALLSLAQSERLPRI